jgi:hypothetical protein
MKKNQLTKEKILSIIKEEAEVIKQKKIIHNQIVELNENIKVLYENRGGLAGTFGFKSDMDAGNKAHVTGFKEAPNISFIAQLEKELKDEEMPEEKPLESVDELASLKKENEELKNKLKNIEESLKPSQLTNK